MSSLSEKLMAVNHSSSRPQWQTLILGSVSDLSPVLDRRPPYRIGLWPCMSEAHPEVAMGLFTVLAYLLGRWDDVCVYRVFTKVEGEPEAYQWDISKSQFQVDDWEIEGLDENIAVWGDLSQSGEFWTLRVEIENDLKPDEEIPILSRTAQHPAGFISLLPSIVDEIAVTLGFGEMPTNSAPYSSVEVADIHKAEVLLRSLFHWERNLLLFLWGKSWEEVQALQDEEALIVAGLALHGDFSGWAVSNAVAEALQPVYDFDFLLPTLQQIAERFPDIALPALTFAKPLYQLGYTQEAVELLETNITEHEGSVGSWLTLAGLYIQSRELFPAVEVLQRAIAADIEDKSVFLAYAKLLTVLDYEGWSLDEFVLIDPNEKKRDQTIWEAVEAYQAILDIKSDEIVALFQQLLLIVDNGLQDSRLWSGFERLVKLDTEGDKVRNVVDSFYILEDATLAIDILRRATKSEPNRADLLVNLAVAYLVEEQGGNARRELEQARTLTDDPVVQADIDRLMLAADDPDFEARLGELTDILSAGNDVDIEDVEFLEEAIAKVPTFADGYLLLAKAYVGWDEPGTALETLLDGQKHLLDDLDILEMLSRLLWEAGQRKLAFEYLNKGLANNPNYVPLLALTGQYLFEDGQTEEAKSFLGRAELIEPRHPALSRVRLAIAKMIGEEGEDESE